MFFCSRTNAELVQGAAAAASRGRQTPSPFRLRSVPWVSSRCPPLPSRAFGSSNRALKRLFAELRRALLYSGHGAAVWTRRRPARSHPTLSQPSIHRSTSRIRTYPFAGIFVKEPLAFFSIEAAVLKRPFNNTLSPFKNVSHELITKYVFSIYKSATHFV